MNRRAGWGCVVHPPHHTPLALCQAYISQGPDYIVKGANATLPLLGVFQKLLTLRSTEIQAFGLLNCIITNFTA